MKRKNNGKKKGKLNDALIKWNAKEHDRKATERELAQKKIHQDRLMQKVGAMYKDWRKRLGFAIKKGRVKTRKELTQAVEQLKLNIRQEIGKEAELSAWMNATFLMLDDLNAKLATDFFDSTHGGSGESAPLAGVEEGVGPTDTEAVPGTNRLADSDSEPSA
jgi:hypothetical protein